MMQRSVRERRPAKKFEQDEESHSEENRKKKRTRKARVVDTMSMKSIATELDKIDVDISMKSDALTPPRKIRASARNRNYNYNPYQNNNDGNGIEESLLEQLDDCSMNNSTDSPPMTKSSARTRFFQNATVQKKSGNPSEINMVSTRRKSYKNQPKRRFRDKTNEQNDVIPMEQDVKPTKTAQPNRSESSTLLADADMTDVEIKVIVDSKMFPVYERNRLVGDEKGASTKVPANHAYRVAPPTFLSSSDEKEDNDADMEKVEANDNVKSEVAVEHQVDVTGKKSSKASDSVSVSANRVNKIPHKPDPNVPPIPDADDDTPCKSKRDSDPKMRVRIEETENEDTAYTPDNEEEEEATVLETSVESENMEDLKDSTESDDEAWKDGENEANSAWAKEAAMYDSSLEEEESEPDDESDDGFVDNSADADSNLDDFQSIRRRTGKKRKSSEGASKKSPTTRVIRRDVEVIPVLTALEKRVELDRIMDQMDGSHLVTKLLICLLWDFNFRYTLLPHQHTGVLVVAGVDIFKASKQLLGLDDTRLDLVFNFEESAGKAIRREVCSTLAFVETRGVVLADDMGLGKTVQGIGAAVLRNGIFAIQSKFTEGKVQEMMPTVIVGPNKDVLDQWEESLLMSGIGRERLNFFHQNNTLLHKGDIFILMTRHNVMSEMRRFMENKRSNLFPQIDISLLKKLENQYYAAKGSVPNHYKVNDENESEYVTRALKKHKLKALFRTLLIDEAHFLKNLVSFWGLGTALLGMASQRSVPISGTPYNNGPQDMATLMAFVDPKLDSSKLAWWEVATEEGDSAVIAANVQEWREDYMIRRDKQILDVKLPAKIVETCSVKPYSSELAIYSQYEKTFLKALHEFSNLSERRGRMSQDQRARQKNLFTLIMATMSCMRMSLIHPLIPKGREITIQFSPSRRHLVSNLAKEMEGECVCCIRYPSQADERSQKTLTDEERNALEGIEAVTEDEHLEDNTFGTRGGRRKKNTKKKAKSHLGELVPMDPGICHAAQKCQHYVHKKCLEQLLSNGNDGLKCPKCIDFQTRLNLSKEKDTRHEVFCEHIPVGPTNLGITATAKILEVIKWAKEIPEGDKAIAYSFFKGGLDIIEGIFVEHLGIECARFDGDVKPEQRSKELAKFKKSKTCRILLASVQSSGVGLNIVEANHVAFLDRWFNPCVHAQAEDRCHRLKQTKEVKVKYFDANMTVDQVMASINNMKKDNASILLADGTSIGAGQSGIKYRDLSGAIGSMMKAVQFERSIPENIIDDQFVQPCSDNALLSASQMAEGTLKARSQKEKYKDDNNSQHHKWREPSSNRSNEPPHENDSSSTSVKKTVVVDFSKDWYVPPPPKFVPPPKISVFTDNAGGSSTILLPEKIEPSKTPMSNTQCDTASIDSDDSDMLPGQMYFSKRSDAQI